MDCDTKASFIHSCGIERTAGKKVNTNTSEQKQNINSDKQTNAFNTLLLGLLLQIYLQHMAFYSQVKIKLSLETSPVLYCLRFHL